MKVLLVHNFYGSEAPSGENQVFEAEKALLQQRGHAVATFTRHSDEIRGHGMTGAIKGAAAVPWNPFAAAALRKVLVDFRPDVVHAHNTFPLISPAIFHAVGRRSARVLTLHNYRLFCSAAIPVRAGRVCTDCLDSRSVWPAIRHGCYRGSHVATVSLAFGVALHRRLGTWQRQVDAFIALTDFQKERMVDGGLPAEKVHVKPNFYPGNPGVTPWQERHEYAVFAGRLTSEKGVASLIRGWAKWAALGDGVPELRIVGDGPLRDQLENLAKNLPVKFFGQLSSSEAQAQIAGARLLLLPSECFEGFPMVIREAFAFGTPVAVSNLGPLPSIVQAGVNGVVFEPGSPASLASVVREAWQSPQLLERLGHGARQAFQQRYTEEANYRLLMEIYGAAIKAQKTTC